MKRVGLYKINETTGEGEYLIGGYAKTDQDIKKERDRLKDRAKQYYGVTRFYIMVE